MYIRCPVCGVYLRTTLGDGCFDKTKPYHYSYKCKEAQNKIVKCPVCGTIFSVEILYSYPLEKNASIMDLPDNNIENNGENKFTLPPLSITPVGVSSYELEQNLTISTNHYMQVPLFSDTKFTIPDGLTLNIEDNAVLFVYKL